MKKEKYYKVVQVKEDRFYSYNKSVYTMGSIEYRINKWTYPEIENSKLFIFKNLQDAYNMAGFNTYKHKVFLCEVKNPHLIQITSLPNTRDKYMFQDFWNGVKNKIYKYFIYTISVPKGSYWCDKVKLISEV